MPDETPSPSGPMITVSATDAAGFSAGFVKLIETVGGGIGKFFAPGHTKRQARADAEAAMVKAQSDIQISEMRSRMEERVLDREMRRQENLEAIAEMARLALPEKVSEKPVDPDWMAKFIDGSQDVGDDEMRQLWGKILAGEIAEPGAFSTRTLLAVKSLSKKEAEMFCEVCAFAWDLDRKPGVLVIPNSKVELLLRNTVSYSDLVILASIGLLIEMQTGNAMKKVPQEGTWLAHYYGDFYEVSNPSGVDILNLGRFAFSVVGSELIEIANAKKSEKYRDLLLRHWSSEGLKFEHLDPAEVVLKDLSKT